MMAMTPSLIITAWKEGQLNRIEVLILLTECLAESNIDPVLLALPAELRQPFVDHLRDYAADTDDPVVTIFGGIFRWEHEQDTALREQMRREQHAEEVARCDHIRRAVVPAIRSWLARGDRAPCSFDGA